MIVTRTCALRGGAFLLATVAGAFLSAQPIFAADEQSPGAAPPASADTESDTPEAEEPTPPTTSDLDRALLESLDEARDSADDAAPAPARRAPPAKADSPPDADQEDADRDKPSADSLDDSLDDELLRDLGPAEGETDEADDPLVRIGRKMQEVERLIAQLEPGEPTQKLQRDIVTEIDELLKEARRQRSQQQSSANKQRQQSRRDQADQPQQQEPAGGQPDEGGNDPARDSTARLRPEATAEPDIGQMQDLLRELWGHLPEHERQQVINSTIEKFVPKYESLIKEYFKRLSEATRAQP
ncbi:MAG: hypothetical protein K2Y37_13175 [Pirellulales bacterium]|nr:hypothetical protein [Pirellulales bacterium]